MTLPLFALALAAGLPVPERKPAPPPPPGPKDPICEGPDGCYMFGPGTEARGECEGACRMLRERARDVAPMVVGIDHAARADYTDRLLMRRGNSIGKSYAPADDVGIPIAWKDEIRAAAWPSARPDTRSEKTRRRDERRARGAS